MSGDAAMRFGLNLPNYSSLGHRDAMIAIAEHADELGYTSLWTTFGDIEGNEFDLIAG